MRSPERSDLRRPVRIIFLIALIIAVVAMMLVRTKLIPYYNLNMGGVDQNVVQGTVRILLGEPLYGDPEAPPFPIVQYAPFFFYVHAAVCWMAGVQAGDVQEIYVIGRILSLLFVLGASWVIFVISRRMKIALPLSIAAAAFFFTSLTDQYFLRPDALFTLLFWCHLLIFIGSFHEPPAGRSQVILLGSLFAVLSIFTKQTGSIVPVISGVFLLLSAKWRMFLQFFLGCVGWTIALSLLLFMFNEPSSVFKNIVLGNVNGIDPRHTLDHLLSKYGLPIVLWVGIGIVTAVTVVLQKDRDPLVGYLACAVLFASFWAGLTALKKGSNTNYYTEAQMLSVLLVLLIISQRRWLAMRGWRPLAAASILLLIPFTALLRSAMYFRSVFITDYRKDQPERYHAEQRLVERIFDHGLKEEEYVLLLSRGYTEMLLAPQTLLNAKDIVMVSGEHFALDISELFEMADDGRMKYVISSFDSSSPLLESVSLEHFRPLFEQDGFTVYIHAEIMDRAAR